uniref:Uncharacterized protein n=1 Tax=Arundo donax TaxID=35708 RepID=A0A0A8XQX3_ARUDO
MEHCEIERSNTGKLHRQKGVVSP